MRQWLTDRSPFVRNSFHGHACPQNGPLMFKDSWGGVVVHKTDQLTCPKPWWMTLNWGVDRIFQQAQRLPVCFYHLTSRRRSGFICMRIDRNGVETGPKMMFAWDNSVYMHNCIIYIYIHMVPLPKSLPFSWAKWVLFYILFIYIHIHIHMTSLLQWN